MKRSRWNAKWLTGLLAMLYALAAFLTAAYGVYLTRHWYPAGRPDALTAEADVARALDSGAMPDLNEALERMALSMGWTDSYVAETDNGSRQWDNGLILGASNTGWTGRTWPELQAQANVDGQLWRGTVGRTFQGADGRHYAVIAVRDQRTLPWVPWQRAAVVLAVAGWLALAAWLAYDVRERYGRHSPGWLLLTLLAGPVALGVWLTARSQADDMVVCPGCGGDTPASAPFCVRCGYAVRPACPHCHRAVAIDWDYCGACGMPLEHAAAAAEGVESL